MIPSMYPGERFNSISHLVGGVLALIGTTSLITVSALQGNPVKTITFAIYGTMLILLYVMSTLYHSLRGPAKQIFRKLDHLSVYLLIAGTYTPFAIVALGGRTGWSIFAAVWALALIGILHELFSHRGPRIIPAILALAMGWLVIFAVQPLAQYISMRGLLWVIAGGVLYSIGTVFFALSRKVRHAHAVWHIFVIFGSIAHFIAVYAYIALRK